MAQPEAVTETTPQAAPEAPTATATATVSEHSWHSFMGSKMSQRPKDVSPSDYLRSIASDWSKFKQDNPTLVRKGKAGQSSLVTPHPKLYPVRLETYVDDGDERLSSTKKKSHSSASKQAQHQHEKKKGSVVPSSKTKKHGAGEDTKSRKKPKSSSITERIGTKGDGASKQRKRKLGASRDDDDDDTESDNSGSSSSGSSSSSGDDLSVSESSATDASSPTTSQTDADRGGSEDVSSAVTDGAKKKKGKSQTSYQFCKSMIMPAHEAAEGGEGGASEQATKKVRRGGKYVIRQSGTTVRKANHLCREALGLIKTGGLRDPEQAFRLGFSIPFTHLSA